MRAVVIDRYGDPSGMLVVERGEPDLEATQVLVRTEAIGVGGVDAVIRRGTIGSGFPRGMVPGSEVAGTVVAVGADVDAALVGRRVWAFTGTSGGYAEYAAAYEDDVTPIPDGLSAVDAVTVGSAATVAHFALAHAHLSAGDALLVRGGAGSIGIAAIELAASAGATTIAATASSAERAHRLRGFGATHTLDRSGRGDDTATAGFDVIVDIVGGPDMPSFIDLLRPNGRYLLVGAVAGYPPPDFGQVLLRSFQKSRSVATFSLDSIPKPERNRTREELFGRAARGEISAVVHNVLRLSEAAEAHRSMDAGSVLGRYVLVPD
ncbi:zinc-binding dehydrogenase [Leifsonia shinshuensis]|uniref:zinc-binding dehydrogenase n=1 Tax=Leifsonia shinshuensis TaxID=150026 RepID=UPI001F50885A|nr:zinc-binding dehydrogenase [Leifsonia shinshuensis]MCI0157100.1 zinc-binding dehydrogenase [Leifsonia shinshuensis]